MLCVGIWTEILNKQMGFLGDSDLGSRLVRNGGSNYNARDAKPWTILDIEVNGSCDTKLSLSQHLCSKTSSSNINLYNYEEIPAFLKSNPYIKKGYRVLLPASQCFTSLFVWNNESVNIWSHLAGFFIFFVSMFVDNITVLSSDVTHFSDHFMITVGLLCYQSCMLLSAGYHLFYCHSEKACRRWLAMDLAGILIGLVGCYIPSVHLAFYCHQLWRDVYMFTVMVLAVITMSLQLHPRFLSNSWSQYRMMSYISLAAYGIIPAVHWIYLNGGFENDLVQLFYKKIIVMYLLAAAAFLFYITKFPECILPGQVDFIGSSHQWWHVIVVIAFLFWHSTGEEILEYRLRQPCQY